MGGGQVAPKLFEELGVVGLGGELFVKGKEGLSVVNFGVGGEVAIIEGEFGVGEIERKSLGEDGLVVVKNGGVLVKEGGEVVDDFGAVKIVGCLHDIDGFRNGDVGDLVEVVGLVEKMDNAALLFFVVAEDAAEDKVSIEAVGHIRCLPICVLPQSMPGPLERRPTRLLAR